ncbi:MAG: glycosyltransferase [Chloroflexi bacterium]|nr:glycosyltransferase [Chloroflexota bacterium]
MRIALFSPLQPLQTAVADVSEGLLPYLAEHAQVDLFIEKGYRPTSAEVKERFPIYSYQEFPSRAGDYDAVVYHMGDEATFHGYIYRTLLKYPGIVVLHDLVLHHCIVGLTLNQGDVESYVEEMRYAYGDEGVELARRVMDGRGEDIFYAYPLVERVLDASLGIIVHNNYAKEEVLRRRPGLKAACVPQQFFLPPGLPQENDPAAIRAELRLTGRFVIASFGFFVPDKRLTVALRAFARFRKNHPEAVYLLVGGHSPYYDLPGHLRNVGLEGEVRLTGWLEPVPFVRYMLATDLAVHLRHPHIGGTPYTPIRLLGLGVPTIVSNIEPLADFPEDCCAKIDVDEYEEEVLLATMEYLATHPEIRCQMGENGRRYIRENHDPCKIARDFMAFIEDVVAHPPSKPLPASLHGGWAQQLVRETAAILAQWGVTEDDEVLLHPVAKALAGLGLFRTGWKEEL